MAHTAKDEYQLWWEYLKLSDIYKKYCESNAFRKTADTAVESSTLRSGLTALLDFTTNVAESLFPADVAGTYLVFGNVHKTQFDDWWESKGKLLMADKYDYQFQKGASDLTHSFKYWIETCDLLYFALYDRKPTLVEFQDHVLKVLQHSNFRYVAINLTKPLKEINDDFKKIVNRNEQKKIKNDKINRQWAECRNRKPTPNLRFDEVKRYLEILKVYKIDGLKGAKAFNKIYPDNDYKQETGMRTVFFRDKRKAEKIAANVFKGYFPGTY